jgi:hypothetical protein
MEKVTAHFPSNRMVKTRDVTELFPSNGWNICRNLCHLIGGPVKVMVKNYGHLALGCREGLVIHKAAIL